MNLRTEIFRSPAFVAVEQSQLGVWLRVMAYCCEQENGGKLEGASIWNDRQWMLACGVLKSEAAACSLIQPVADSSDLLIVGYPSEKETEVKSNREAGRKGGGAKTQAKTQAAKANGQRGGRPITQAETQAKEEITQAPNPSETQAKPKGMEWKDKRREENRNRARWFPESLRSETFKVKWQLWEEHVGDAGKIMTDASRKAQLVDCEKHGEFDSIAAINEALRNGWKSIVWDWQKSFGKTGTPPTGYVLRACDIPAPQTGPTELQKAFATGFAKEREEMGL